MIKFFKDSQNELFRNPSKKVLKQFALTEITEQEFNNLIATRNAQAYNTVADAVAAIMSLYDQAMLKLQGKYSDQEVKTFFAKQEAIREYVSGGIAALSADNRLMIESITGSTEDAVLAGKMENMVLASRTFKQYLGQIERLRDEHVERIVDGEDNTGLIDSLRQSYNL